MGEMYHRKSTTTIRKILYSIMSCNMLSIIPNWFTRCSSLIYCTIIFNLNLIILCVQADLPVHCYYAEIPGVWEYYIGNLQPKKGFNGENFDTRCGMASPGDPDGWQELTPTDEGYGEFNKYLGKYHLTNRFQNVGKLTLLLRDDETVRVLAREDYYVEEEDDYLLEQEDERILLQEEIDLIESSRAYRV